MYEGNDTFFYDINNNGVIVGNAWFSGGTQLDTVAFKYFKGKYEFISVPGALATYVSGINDKGQVVGSYAWDAASPNNSKGFLFDGSSYTDINYPSGVRTTLHDINNKYQVLGESYLGGYAYDKFIWENDSFKKIENANAIYFTVRKLNDYKQFVGDFTDINTSQQHGYISFPKEIIIQPEPRDVFDAWITSIYSNKGQDDYKLRVGGWGDQYYSLIKFDISNLPPNVSSAKVLLYSFYDGHSYRTSMYLDRVTSSWNERVKWETHPTYQSIETIAAPILDSWYSIDITDLYNGWKAGTYENYGIQLRPVSISDAMNAFYSSDYRDNPSLRPKLVLEVE